MSAKKKRYERFLACPADLTWTELSSVLADLGYTDVKEAAGSRVKFRGEGLPKLNLHRPHNPPLVRQYVIREVLAKLREKGIIP